jgi:hypothetical protein
MPQPSAAIARLQRPVPQRGARAALSLSPLGFWLYTPGGGGEAAPCGEAEAYTSEFTPGATYQVLLFVTASNGTKQIGSTAEFTVTPALPR